MTEESHRAHKSESSCTSRLWPELSRPEMALPCDHCELVHHSRKLVWGEGNAAAPVWVLLDNPGLRETASGDPFVCGTRQTLQQAIRQVGFQDNDILVTFVIRRRPRRAYDKAAERIQCMQNFWRQFADVPPSHLMCLGDIAVQAIREDAAASVRQCRSVVPLQRGSTKIFVSYHPLAVRRRPNLWETFVSDWTQVYHDWHETVGLT